MGGTMTLGVETKRPAPPAARPVAGLAAGMLVAGMILAAPALAQQPAPKRLGSFQDWTAYEYQEAGEKVCFILSRPTRKNGAERSRGDAYVMVTYRTADKVRDEVSVNFGATLKEKSQAQMQIGGTKVPMVTNRDTAWTTNPGQDKVAVDAMVRGADMQISAVTSKGTQIDDTYSLMGVTAARKAITDACR